MQHLQTSNLSDGLERSPRTGLDVVHSLSCDSSVTAEVLGSGSLEASMYNENTLKQLDMAVIGVDRPYYGQVRTSLLSALRISSATFCLAMQFVPRSICTCFTLGCEASPRH